MTSLKESMISPNSACWKMSSFFLLSSFHLWDSSCLGIFIYSIKDRAKGEGGVTQTFLQQAKALHLVFSFWQSAYLCQSRAFYMPLSGSGTLLQVYFIWSLSIFPTGRVCQFLLAFLTLLHNRINTFHRYLVTITSQSISWTPLGKTSKALIRMAKFRFSLDQLLRYLIKQLMPCSLKESHC